jgi:hypothetical protein
MGLMEAYVLDTQSEQSPRRTGFGDEFNLEHLGRVNIHNDTQIACAQAFIIQIAGKRDGVEQLDHSLPRQARRVILR